MTLTIELDEEAAAALRADAEAQGRDAASVAAERLTAFYAEVEPGAIVGIAQGLAEAEAGLAIPFEQHLEESRAQRASRRAARLATGTAGDASLAAAGNVAR